MGPASHKARKTSKGNSKEAMRRERARVQAASKAKLLAKDSGLSPDIIQRIKAEVKTPNVTVAFIPLTASADPLAARNVFAFSPIFTHHSTAFNTSDLNSATVLNVKCKTFKNTLSLFYANRTINSVLDALKVADAVVFVAGAEEADPLTDDILAAIDAHGAPALAAAAVTPSATPAVPPQDVLSWLQSRTGATTGAVVDAPSSFNVIATSIARSKPTPVRWTTQYPTLLAESAEYNPQTGQLLLEGFLRNTPLCPDRTIHIVGHGDFQCVGLAQVNAPTVVAEHVLRGTAAPATGALATPATPDPLINLYPADTPAPAPTLEQCLTAPAAAHANETPLEASVRKACEAAIDRLNAMIGAGTSQEEAAASLIADNPEIARHLGFDVPTEFVKPHIRDLMSADEAAAAALAGLEHGDIIDTTAAPGDLSYGRHVPDLEERARDELDFADELDTPQPPITARNRFSKYCGLQSFRTSVWNTSVGLPPFQNQLVGFADEALARKEALARSHNSSECVGALPGQWTGLVLSNVSPESAEAIIAQIGSNGEPLAVAGLLIHETQMTLATLAVRRADAPVETEATRTARQIEEAARQAAAGAAAPAASTLARVPLPSKTPMVLHVGFRRMLVRPLFATYAAHTRHGAAAKSRYLRFAPDDRTAFALHAYMPCVLGTSVPVIGFQAVDVPSDARSGSFVDGPMPSGNPHIVGTHDGTSTNGTGLRLVGTSVANDPNQLIIKRIVLTGYPRKINTKSAVVRWMFWLPEDVRWFSNVELTTRRGTAGHITQSVADFGVFKADFSRPVSFADTICMKLYKRVFPPAPCTTLQISAGGYLPLNIEGAPAFDAERGGQGAGEWDDVDMVL